MPNALVKGGSPSARNTSLHSKAACKGSSHRRIFALSFRSKRAAGTWVAVKHERARFPTGQACDSPPGKSRPASALPGQAIGASAAPAVGLTGRHISREDEDERPPAPARRFVGHCNGFHFEQFGGFQSVEALRKGRCWGCEGRRGHSSPRLVCRLPTFPAPGRPRAPDRK